MAKFFFSSKDYELTFEIILEKNYDQAIVFLCHWYFFVCVLFLLLSFNFILSFILFVLLSYMALSSFVSRLYYAFL